jgi:hypothetical protein
MSTGEYSYQSAPGCSGSGMNQVFVEEAEDGLDEVDDRVELRRGRLREAAVDDVQRRRPVRGGVGGEHRLTLVVQDREPRLGLLGVLAARSSPLDSEHSVDPPLARLVCEHDNIIRGE